jgi:hypothetical protein
MQRFRDLPELVRDSKLEVILRDNITIHTEPLECRDEFSPQRWETKGMIGHGGGGAVFLQRKVDGPGTIHSLAVKQMRLMSDLASEDHESKRYVHELEALAKFAQGRVSHVYYNPVRVTHLRPVFALLRKIIWLVPRGRMALYLYGVLQASGSRQVLGRTWNSI